MEPDSLIGQRVFGGYVVTRPIGAGGMGEVYLVENIELNKQLVIKVLLPERSSDAELVERFLAEARAAAAIRHRHIVEILDSSTLPDGRPYILMEYLEGETLFAFGQRNAPVPVDIALPILAQVCSGLEAAHKRGVVHRDIKPSNIFMAPEPDNPYFTKILDFGIAKLEDPTLAGGLMTRSVMIAGTPHYMSPEQARTLHGVDHRTDLYAVGVIAYELLTGRVPYEAHSIGELVFQQTRGKPPSVHELQPDVPEAWSELLEQTLATDADERPPSARDLALLMIAATEDGIRIAKEAAPLLFTRGETSSHSHRSASMAESPISVVRSRPPMPRRVEPMRPRSSTGGRGAAADIGQPRKTKVLEGGSERVNSALQRPASAGPLPAPSSVTERPRAASHAAKKPSYVARSRPPGGTNPPVVYASPPEMPASFVADPTSVMTERKPSGSPMRWLIIGLVLAASIGAAIAIGLFTGPSDLGDSNDESRQKKTPAAIDAGVDARP